MTNLYAKGAVAAMLAIATAAPAVNAQSTPEKVTGWGDFKLYLDPGHEGRSNMGIWNYSEAEKVLDVALNIRQMLTDYTDMAPENLKMCRETQTDTKGLQERSDEANAWGADFFYSIHSDAGNVKNEIVLLFGGWKKNGELVEKTPKGGKRYGEFLEPNLSGVMRIGSRGNRYDRDFYMPGENTHYSQYPYLSVNRESNMASLLSEGGYHTQASQQQRNVNAEYRRLEAFAAFQSILQYRGMELPKMTFLHGVVTNSENDQPINGATVTVGGKTYTTETFESHFNKFTKNPNLIHNGLYTFEGLEAGKEYEVKVEAPGFEPVTAKATIKAGGEHTPDFVTFLDIQMTNVAPAKVDAISVENVGDVSPLKPLTITFSRKMDRASVEKAFSVNNGGSCALSWQNDYTLDVDVSKLDPGWDYTITIDGSIARNSQTNMLFDGDGDGQPGGNYVLTITMAEPDTEAPQVVSTYPAAESEVVYTHRPPIRIEFDEEIVWNDDNAEGAIIVRDADGKDIAGKVNHAVIRGHSVLHFIANADYPVDKAILVTVKGGIADNFGNATSDYSFRFLTEYRPQKDAVTIIPCTGLDSFWAPGGSGSSAGLDKDNSTTTTLPVSPNYQSNQSVCMNYVFDAGASTPNWFIRMHNPTYTKNRYSDYTGVITFWVYGDGSNNGVNMLVRVPNGSGGLKMKEEYMPVDFRGWNLFTWKLLEDPYTHFTGTQNIDGSGTWAFDAFALKHEDTDPDDEEIPYQEWEGNIAFNSLEQTHWDETATRTAKLEDVAIPDGVDDIAVDANAPVRIFNLNGVEVSGNLAPGLYIRRQGGVSTKIVVK
ncbi:MAG: Ig-like domain-containing protein [Muribaculaceae bacterium]|nr:Ig-like domain-containing protein [Muribaculaceae bacterium]